MQRFFFKAVEAQTQNVLPHLLQHANLTKQHLVQVQSITSQEDVQIL